MTKLEELAKITAITDRHNARTIQWIYNNEDEFRRIVQKYGPDPTAWSAVVAECREQSCLL